MEKILLTLVVLSTLTIIGTLATMSARASGQITWCYIKVRPNEDKLTFSLKGHIDWREDTIMGNFQTFDDAIEASKKVGCPLNK